MRSNELSPGSRAISTWTEQGDEGRWCASNEDGGEPRTLETRTGTPKGLGRGEAVLTNSRHKELKTDGGALEQSSAVKIDSFEKVMDDTDIPGTFDWRVRPDPRSWALEIWNSDPNMVEPVNVDAGADRHGLDTWDSLTVINITWHPSLPIRAHGVSQERLVGQRATSPAARGITWMVPREIVGHCATAHWYRLPSPKQLATS